MSPFEPIVAPITGSCSAPVALIRVSGGDSWRIAREVFDGLPDDPEAGRAYYGRYATGDDGLCVLFKQGHGFTGEEAVEISCHGSRAAVRTLVEACIQAGARPAEPGEFTQRAFMNGRMDLTEAEAVRDTVEALTDAQLRLANMQREGALRFEISMLREHAIRLLAAVEATVDFEEEIGPLDRSGFKQDVESLIRDIERLLETAAVGHIMRQGLRVAIVGPPNAGKSSLLNALLGSERAIVTEVPGTTRDFVEEKVDLGGVPVVLIDTAGLRETADPVESIGVQRSRTQAANADLVWYVYDATVGFSEADRQAADSFGRPVQIVANKVDLHPGRPGDLAVSTLTRQGLEELSATLSKYADEAAALALPPVNERHERHLCEAKTALSEALKTIRYKRPDDLLAVSLQGAIQSLGRITGETESAEMLEEIFRSFCIGK